jgi:hypothetical protein
MAQAPRPAAKGVPTRPVLSATPARQGRLGRQVFWVLVISTLAAAAALAALWAWKLPDFNAANSGNGPARSGPAFHAPTPPPPDPGR